MKDPDFDFIDVVEHLSDAIVITKAYPLDKPGPEIVYANHAYCQQNGFASKEVVGKNLNILQLVESGEGSEISHPRALDRKYGPKMINKKGKESSENRWIELTINPLKNDSAETAYLVVIERDLTEQKKFEEQLQASSGKDLLTNLLSREAFDDALMQEFSIFSRTKHTYSLLLIDIDHFKKINTNHGDAACTQVLSQMANLFEEIFRFYDLTARIGRDQFCVLFRSTSLEPALISAIRFRQTVQNREFTAGRGSVHVTVRIGVSQVLSTDKTHIQLVERAEKALKLAKNNGSDQVQIYKDDMAL